MVNKYCRTGKIQDMSNIRAIPGTLLSQKEVGMLRVSDYFRTQFDVLFTINIICKSD
jgi:hypothetical protein